MPDLLESFGTRDDRVFKSLVATDALWTLSDRAYYPQAAEAVPAH